MGPIHKVPLKQSSCANRDWHEERHHFTYTVSFVCPHRVETGNLESTQNLLHLFSISRFCCVLIGVRVRPISAGLHVVIVRVNWIIHTGEWLTGGELHFLAQTQRFCPNFSRKERRRRCVSRVVQSYMQSLACTSHENATLMQLETGWESAKRDMV